MAEVSVLIVFAIQFLHNYDESAFLLECQYSLRNQSVYLYAAGASLTKRDWL